MTSGPHYPQRSLQTHPQLLAKSLASSVLPQVRCPGRVSHPLTLDTPSKTAPSKGQLCPAANPNTAHQKKWQKNVTESGEEEQSGSSKRCHEPREIRWISNEYAYVYMFIYIVYMHINNECNRERLSIFFAKLIIKGQWKAVLNYGFTTDRDGSSDV